MTEKDVDISVEDGILTLSGERKAEAQERGYSERFYGRFERQIALPKGIDEEKAEARFKDGVLTITFPRTQEAATGRRIPIKGE